MKSFEELKEHTKVVDKIQSNGKRIDGQVCEILHLDGQIYLASAKSIWPIYQFDPKDYELYEGNKAVGEYL